MLIGIVLACVGGLAGLGGLSEMSDYSRLQSAGNPFAGLKGDTGLALIAVGIVGVLAGIAAIIAATQFPKRQPQVLAFGQTRHDGAVWTGEQWVTASSFEAVHGAPPSA